MGKIEVFYLDMTLLACLTSSTGLSSMRLGRGGRSYIRPLWLKLDLLRDYKVRHDSRASIRLNEN